jgi:hypothetical protein
MVGPMVLSPHFAHAGRATVGDSLRFGTGKRVGPSLG